MASNDQTGQDEPPAVMVAVAEAEIDTGQVVSFVADPTCGASVLFLGTVRDHSAGKHDVTHLEYEAYAEHVVPKMREIVDEAFAEWPIVKMAAVHRTGDVPLGGVSVAVAASSPHRADAFEAARYVIDELKKRAPIWKKEHWPGGAEWVEGA